MSSKISPLAEQFLNLLLANEHGLSDSQLREHFPPEYYEKLPVIINELLSKNRLQLYEQTNGLLYKAIKEETAAKFEGLAPEQILVYQQIEKASTKGIWSRDLKNLTKLPLLSLTKALKTLETRQLIKSIRSISSKTKKLYILYNLTPDKSITGGPWYSNDSHEFDHEFVNELKNFIVMLVKNMKLCDIDMIYEQVRVSGISKIELSMEELELVVNTLIYELRIEEVQSSVLMLTNNSSGKKKYKASRSAPCDFNYLTSPSATYLKCFSSITETPCGLCPVAAQCSPNGVISPQSCTYYQDWLDNSVDTMLRMEEEAAAAAENDGSEAKNVLDW